MTSTRITALLTVACLSCCSRGATRPAQGLGTPASGSGYVSVMARQAVQLEQMMDSTLGLDFVRAAGHLPSVPTRRLYSTRQHDARKRTIVVASELASFPQDRRAELEELVIDEEYYYAGKWGSPLAYGRPIDLLGAAGMASVRGKRIFDFGYGAIGHLFQLCSLGATVTGVDVDPILPHLYGGEGRGAGWTDDECPKLVHGYFPTTAAIVEGVGRDYDLIISKNVLKRGYIHPDPNRTPAIDLGRSDAQFVKLLFDMLRPGGYVMLYNVTPPPNGPGREYRTWADGRSPFSRDVWVAAGFEVLAYDENDDAGIRAVGRVLGWEDVDQQFFALYTLARRPLDLERK